MENIQSKEKKIEVRRGDILLVDLSPIRGSEQGGVRPVVVIQNNMGNMHSPTLIVAAITTKTDKCRMPTHVTIPRKLGLFRKSVVLLEQLRTIDRTRVVRFLGSTDKDTMQLIDNALSLSVGLDEKGDIPSNLVVQETSKECQG